RNVLLPTLAPGGLHLSAHDGPLVYRGATLVRGTVDARAGGGHHRSARDRSRAGPRSLAGPRISSAAGVVMLQRVLLIGAALVGCRPAAGQVDLRSPAALIAERIRTRIEAAGVVMELRAAGEPVYATLVLPSFYERRLYRPAWSDEHGPTRLTDDLLDALRRADLEGRRSEDFHLAGIEAVLAAVRAEAKRGPALAPPPDRWAELDLLLTDAFLV